MASLPANPWGLYEMHGNIWEWCSDWFGPYLPDTQHYPEGPPDGEHRVLRGGCWDDLARYLRAACRYHNVADFRCNTIGLRIAPGRAAY